MAEAGGAAGRAAGSFSWTGGGRRGLQKNKGREDGGGENGGITESGGAAHRGRPPPPPLPRVPFPCLRVHGPPPHRRPDLDETAAALAVHRRGIYMRRSTSQRLDRLDSLARSPSRLADRAGGPCSTDPRELAERWPSAETGSRRPNKMDCYFRSSAASGYSLGSEIYPTLYPRRPALPTSVTSQALWTPSNVVAFLT